jgi:hypothetical protein
MNIYLKNISTQQSLQLGDTLVRWRALAGAVRLRFIKWLSPRDDIFATV